MTDKLKLYNASLAEMGERKLASLSEGREARRILDTAWDNDFVRACLSAGQWNFAVRSQLIDYSPSVEPDFGYSRAFDKPTDWVRTVGFASDEYFKSPLLEYSDEAGYWFADLDQIFVRYVSDDVQYGADLSLWPANFTKYAQAYLASLTCEQITKAMTTTNRMEALSERRLRQAKSTDAMDEATKFSPQGAWAGARQRYGYSRERGR